MSDALAVAPRPCESCPYRRDCPAGLWASDEYDKLPGYDDNTRLGTFLCHLSNATNRLTVCRGWLTVHAESAAARIAVLRGEVTDAQRYASVDVALYPSGAEAAAAGLAGVSAPGADAQRLIDKLVRRGAGKLE